MFSTIIVPFDFSPACRGALRHAAVIAEHEQASLHCLHVLEELAASTELGWALDRESIEKVRERLDHAVAEAQPVENLRSGWRSEVLEGDPSRRIAEHATAEPAPLVVAPTHGRGGFRRLLAGSVVNKLLHDLACPLLTGAHLDAGDEFPSAGYRRILCALSGGPESEAALLQAKAVAESWSADLTIVNAINIYRGGPVRIEDFPEHLRRYYVDSARRDIGELLARHHCSAKVVVEFQTTEELVPATVRETDADLVIVGRDHNQGLGAIFSHHVYEIVRQSPVPVLSVPGESNS